MSQACFELAPAPKLRHLMPWEGTSCRRLEFAGHGSRGIVWPCPDTAEVQPRRTGPQRAIATPVDPRQRLAQKVQVSVTPGSGSPAPAAR